MFLSYLIPNFASDSEFCIENSKFKMADAAFWTVLPTKYGASDKISYPETKKLLENLNRSKALVNPELIVGPLR